MLKKSGTEYLSPVPGLLTTLWLLRVSLQTSSWDKGRLVSQAHVLVNTHIVDWYKPFVQRMRKSATLIVSVPGRTGQGSQIGLLLVRGEGGRRISRPGLVEDKRSVKHS